MVGNWGLGLVNILQLQTSKAFLCHSIPVTKRSHQSSMITWVLVVLKHNKLKCQFVSTRVTFKTKESPEKFPNYTKLGTLIIWPKICFANHQASKVIVCTLYTMRWDELIILIYTMNICIYIFILKTQDTSWSNQTNTQTGCSLSSDSFHSWTLLFMPLCYASSHFVTKILYFDELLGTIKLAKSFFKVFLF